MQDKKYVEPFALKFLRFLTNAFVVLVVIVLAAWFLVQLIRL
jgi:membrane-bound ClpP family serine protease